MANQILALEAAYSMIVTARMRSHGAIDEKLGRIRDYIAAQLSEAVKNISAE